MRSLMIVCVVLLLSSILVTAQQPAKPSGEEAHLLALESAWNHAEQGKDATALGQLLADTFTYVDYDGTFMIKKEYLASTVTHEVQQEQIINEGMIVHLYGNAAVVNGIYRDKGLEGGKPFSRHGRFTDTWIRTQDTWQCVASQSTLMK